MNVRRKFESKSTDATSLVLANLVPIVGVVAFDWNVLALLVLYWIEGIAVFLRTAVEGTFAGRPTASEARVFDPPFGELRAKRGSVSVGRWLPPVYPRNVPEVLAPLQFAAVSWAVLGVGLYALGGRSLLGNGDAVGVLLGALAVVVAQAIAFRDHVESREYESLATRSVLAVGHVFGLVILVAVMLFAVYGSADGQRTGVGVVFAGFFATKLALDVYEFVSGSESSRLASLVDSLTTEHAGVEEPIEAPDGEPIASFETDRRSVWVNAIPVGVVRTVGSLASVFVLLTGAFVGYVYFGVPEAVGVVTAVAVTSVVLTVLREDVLAGHLAYDIYENDVVARDRLLGEPQWRVSRSAITDVAVGYGVLGRWTDLGTGSVKVKRRDGSPVRLVYLADPEEVASRLTPTYRD